MSSGCVRLRKASDSRATRPQRHRIPVYDSKHRRQQHLARPLQPASIVSEGHFCLEKIGHDTLRRRDADPLDEVADESPGKVRVAEHRAPDGARRSGPCLEPCAPVMNRPSHEPIDRHSGVGAHQTGRDLLDGAAAGTNDQSTDARVRHQHVRSTSQDGDREPGRMREPQRATSLVTAPGLDEPVGRAADPERRERCERRVATDAGSTERTAQQPADVAHTGSEHVTARIRRSRAISAAIASAGEQTTNEIESPGANCPARPRSAVMTVAIVG